MLDHRDRQAAAVSATRPRLPWPDASPRTGSRSDADDHGAPGRTADRLHRLATALCPHRRVVRAGDRLYRAGDECLQLHIVSAGIVKLQRSPADGRSQMVGLRLKGDWLGFDGLATRRHASEAIAMDVGEIWTVRYDVLLAACADDADLLSSVHAAMSAEIGRDRDSMLALCTLPAGARVAEFLCRWAEALAERGLRSDQISLRLTRAEIGNYLGMTLETVSRALSGLARIGAIEFTGRARREIRIPDIRTLADAGARRQVPVRARMQ